MPGLEGPTLRTLPIYDEAMYHELYLVQYIEWEKLRGNFIWLDLFLYFVK